MNKLRTHLAAVLCGTCLLAPAQEKTQFSSRLAKVAGHLDSDGVFFSLKNSEGDLKAGLQQLDGLLKGMGSEMGLPPNLNLAEMTDPLGLDHLLASGASSKKAGPHWHNRSFFLTEGKHEGLLSLFGDKARAWEAPQFAPAGTDLLLEFDLDLRKTEAMARKIGRSFGVEKKMDETFGQQLSSKGITLSDLLKGFTVRTSLVYWEDENDSFKVNEAVTLPIPHLAIRMDNARILWKAWGEEITADSEVRREVRRENGVITSFAPETETPFGVRKMMLRYEEKTGVLWFALQENDYTRCAGKGKHLADGEKFQAAVKGLPESGQGLAFISAGMCQTLQKLSRNAGGMLPPDAAYVGDLVKNLADSMDSPNGYASAMALENDGILLAFNSPFAQKTAGMNSLAGIAGVSALAGLATPVILKAQKAAEITEDSNNLRQIGTLMVLYDQDFGAYPDNLGQLVEKGYIEPAAAQNNLKFDRYTYYPGYSTADNGMTIILSSPASGGKVAYLRSDSSVQQVREEKFKALLAKQKEEEAE